MSERSFQIALSALLANPRGCNEFLSGADAYLDALQACAEDRERLIALRKQNVAGIRYFAELICRKRSVQARRLAPWLFEALGSERWSSLWRAFQCSRKPADLSAELLIETTAFVDALPGLADVAELQCLKLRRACQMDRLRLRAASDQPAAPPLCGSAECRRRDLPARVRPIRACRVPQDGPLTSGSNRKEARILVAFHARADGPVMLYDLSAAQVRVLRHCDGLTTPCQIASALGEFSDDPPPSVVEAVKKTIESFVSIGLVRIKGSMEA